MESQERWTDIPGFEGEYQISDDGRVRLARSGRKNQAGYVYHPSRDRRGYLQIRLRETDGPGRQWLVHRLVMRAFVGPCPQDKQVNHKDGNKANNCLENLEYVTQSENMKHARRIGLRSDDHLRGTKHPRHKLTEDDVREIRRLHGNVRAADLAKRFKVTRTLIHNIQGWRTWKHVRDEATATNNDSRIYLVPVRSSVVDS